MFRDLKFFLVRLRYARPMWRFGRDRFRAAYFCLFTVWGIYEIVTHTHGFDLALGIALLAVGLGWGFAWFREWHKARAAQHGRSD